MNEADDDFNKKKEIAYYSNLVNAWISSSMERDKSIFYIAAGGIGLLITLASSSRAVTQVEFLLYFLALSAFLLTIILLLFVFHRNTIHIKHYLINGTEKDEVLGYLDKLVTIIFGLGIVFSFFIAITVLNRHSLVINACVMQEKKEIIKENLKIDKLKPESKLKNLNPIPHQKPKNVLFDNN